MIPQSIRSQRAEVRSFVQSVVFKKQKRVNLGKIDKNQKTKENHLGNCYGSSFKKELFPEFLKLYEAKHKEIVRSAVALVVVGDEGRGSLKFNLIYSTSKYQINAKYTIMLMIAEMKESSSSLCSVLHELPLKAIKDRADQLQIPLYFSGNILD